MRMELVVVYLKVLSRHLSGGNEDDHEYPYSHSQCLDGIRT